MIKLNWWEPEIGKNEIKAVTKVINSNYLNQGKITKQFENKISKILKVKYVVATTSGTAAIFLALKSLGVGVGDEVIVPNITFVATASAVQLTGAKVVLADVDINNLSISTKYIKSKITKKTKVIIPVHISGRASNINEILKIIKNKKKIFIVEDAAEAFYSKLKNKYLGTIGDIGCFSFSPNKIITTGQGGALVTNNFKLYKKIKLLTDHGRVGVPTGGDDKHVAIGYNFKFSNLQSAIGISQLKLLKKRSKKIKFINGLYSKYLVQNKKFRLFDVKDTELPLWTDAFATNRDKIIKILKKNNIECRKFWKPINKLPPYKKNSKLFKNSNFLNKKIFWLPSSFKLKKKDVIRICKIINSINKT